MSARCEARVLNRGRTFARVETQERLGWRPTQPGLLPDLDRPSYFDT
jgi:hypothetical protein